MYSALIHRPELIGGGVVRRRFSLAGEVMLAGRELTGAQIRAMTTANRKALLRAGFLDVWPVHSGPSGDRFVVNLGFGKFDVVEGRKLNSEPLTKEQATALATSAPAVKAA